MGFLDTPFRVGAALRSWASCCSGNVVGGVGAESDTIWDIGVFQDG